MKKIISIKLSKKNHFVSLIEEAKKINYFKCEYIDKYNLSKKKIIKIAKAVGLHCFSWKASEISNINISKEERLNIAKKFAQKSPILLLNNLDKYNLSNSDFLSIADIILNNNIEVFCENFNIFKFDEPLRINYAKKATIIDGAIISKYISNFKLSDQKELCEIFIESSINNKECYSDYDNYNFKEEYTNAHYPELLLLVYDETVASHDVDRVVELQPKVFQPTIREILSKEDVFVRKKLLRWISWFILNCKQEKVNFDHINNYLTEIKRLINLRPFELKCNITKILIDTINKKENYSESFHQNWSEKRKEKISIRMLLYKHLGLDEGNPHQRKLVRNFLFSNKISGNQETKILETLTILINTKKLETSEKQELILSIIARKDISTKNKIINLEIIKNLISLDSLYPIKRSAKIDDLTHILKKRIDSIWKGLCSVSEYSINNLLEDNKRFNAIHDYLITLKKLGYENEIKLYGKFFESLVKGIFNEIRYARNKHLNEVFSYSPSIESKWKENTIFNENDQVIESDSASDLLLSGTEIDNSCLKIKNGDKNMLCLVTNIMDGKIKCLLIKNSAGRIIARAYLKILINNNTREPVLFLEKTYVHKSFRLEDAELLFIKASIKKAKVMNIQLYGNYASKIYFEMIKAINFYQLMGEKLMNILMPLEMLQKEAFMR